MKILSYVLLSLVGLMTLTATTDAEAYWHGYRGGWRGPGWGGGCYRCGPGWVAPVAVVAGAEVVEGSTAPPVVVEQAQVWFNKINQQPAQMASVRIWNAFDELLN